MTKIVEVEPGQVDLKDSSGSESELSDMFFLDSSDVASCFLDNLITQNADFVAFG